MRRAILLATAILLLFPAAALAERVSVGVDEANLRSGPGTNYPILWKVERYHPFEVMARQGDWVRVRDFEGDQAWIFGKLLSDTDATITKAEKVNVRSEANTKSAVLFRAERGVPFQVLDRQGKWVRVRHADGDMGWIHNSLLW